MLQIFRNRLDQRFNNFQIIMAKKNNGFIV